MFADAYEKASAFTRPVFLSRLTGSGSVETSIASYVVISPTHALTAGHVVQDLPKFETEIDRMREYEQQVEEVRKSHDNPQKRDSEVAKLWKSGGPQHLTSRYSFFLGDGVRTGEIVVFPPGDLALVELTDFPSALYPGEFPAFKRPEQSRMGSSLMRLGYPFHRIEASWDESRSSFVFADGALPVPRFPIDGIATRWQQRPSPDPDVPVVFLETSSPGLRGQSGGPVVDVDGCVWGIQSQTIHFALGFSPEARSTNGDAVVEHQFLNVGVAVSTTTIGAFLEKQGVQINWA